MLKIFRSRPAGLTLVYTGDPVPRGPVVFLAGPTARTGRTEWRLRAVEEIRTLGYQGAVVVPEFASGDFDGEARARGWVGDSPVSGLARRGYEVVSWETEGIRAAEARGALLFWMPFTAPETGPDGLPARSSMPGMTTRSEFAAALARPSRLVAGMPPDAWGASWTRYHAAARGLRLHATLSETCAAAVRRAR